MRSNQYNDEQERANVDQGRFRRTDCSDAYQTKKWIIHIQASVATISQTVSGEYPSIDTVRKNTSHRTFCNNLAKILTNFDIREAIEETSIPFSTHYVLALSNDLDREERDRWIIIRKRGELSFQEEEESKQRLGTRVVQWIQDK